MSDLEQLLDALALIEKMSNKYLGPRDYEVKYHAACIKSKFMGRRAAMEANHANS